MPFEKIDSLPKKLRNMKSVYLRLSPGGSCYLSAGFRDLQPELYSSIDFEFDPVTEKFRFRVGKGFERKIMSGAFCLPAAITNLITGRNGNRFNRMFYYKVIRLSDGWFTGEFVAVNKMPSIDKIFTEENK